MHASKDDKLPKSAETEKQEVARKRGRPQLRWEECVKRDLRKAEEEEKLREKANDRDQWKKITKVAVLRSDRLISLTLTQGKPAIRKKRKIEDTVDGCCEQRSGNYDTGTRDNV